MQFRKMKGKLATQYGVSSYDGYDFGMPGLFIHRTCDGVRMGKTWQISHAESGLRVSSRHDAPLTREPLVKLAHKHLGRIDWTRSAGELQDDKKAEKAFRALRKAQSKPLNAFEKHCQQQEF